MRNSEHCEKSLELFGEEGKEYHSWIDCYTFLGYKHRFVLHHKEGVEIGVQIFGEDARKHLEQHLKDDWGTTKIPSIKELRKKEGSPYPNRIETRIISK